MAEIRDVQLVELELLKYFEQISSMHNLKYTLGYGSLLGAIRHRGFIPWDDDVDVFMSIDDFLVFQRECKDKRYFLQTPLSDIQAPFEMIKLRKNNTYMPEPGKQIVSMHQGIWIDIFLYTNAGKTALSKKLQTFFMHCLISYRNRYYHVSKGGWKKIYKILCDLPIKAQLGIDNFLIEVICGVGSKKSNEYFLIGNRDDNIYERQLFDVTKYCDFENLSLQISNDSDLLLRKWYGDTYMIPVKWSHLQEHSSVELDISIKKEEIQCVKSKSGYK